MTLRLRWTPSDEGEPLVFPLRGGKLALRFDAAFATLTPIQGALGDQDGILAEDAAGDGRVLLKSTGRARLRIGEKESLMVRLSVGVSIRLIFPDFDGEVALEGSAPMQDELLGTDLAGYRLLGRLGQGAVGTVYRALQINLNREIALKVLNAQACTSPLAVASFKREAQAAGRLQHPNVVQVYDVGESGGRHFYAMEIVAGGSLEETLTASGPIPWDEALPMVQDTAEALAFAASHDLLHRDIKPDNLMLTATGVVKLADLGLASTRKMLDKESAGGTPHFMAPESLQGQPDYRADFYSLGCTLYRLLTHEVPYPADDVRGILLGHRDGDIPTLSDAGISAPSAVQDLIDSLIAKEPEDRPHRAEDIVDAVSLILESGKRPASKGLLIVFILILVSGAAWFFTNPATPDEEHQLATSEVEKANAESADQSVEIERQKAELELMKELRAVEQISDLPVRIDALQAFITVHPTGHWVDEARTSLENAKRSHALELLQAEKIATPVAADAEQIARESVQPLLDAGKWAKALRKLQSDDVQGFDASQLASWRAEIVSAAEAALLHLETEFRSAIRAQDWPKAEQLRLQFHAGVSPIPDDQADWLPRLRAFDAAVQEAKHREAATALRLDANRLSATLLSNIAPKLFSLEIKKALLALEEINQQWADTPFAPALQAMALELEAASYAAQALRNRFDFGDFFIIEPVTEKRAQLVAFTGQGIRLIVRERGKPVERLDPWSTWMTPNSFDLLLQEGCQDRCTETQRLALYALIAQLDLFRIMQEWAGLPEMLLSEHFYARSSAWHTTLSTQLSAGDTSASRVIENLLFVGSSLSSGNDFLAWQSIQNCLSVPSTLSLFAGPNQQVWGLKP